MNREQAEKLSVEITELLIANNASGFVFVNHSNGQSAWRFSGMNLGLVLDTLTAIRTQVITMISELK